MATVKNNFTKNDVKKTYRFYAPIYDFLFGAILHPGRNILLKKVSDLKPSCVLEIGVGTGLLLPEYPPNISVTGIDVSEDMLKIARNRTKLIANKEIYLLLMDAENLSFDDESFDCVVLPYVLSVTPNPSQLIREVRRVCKKDGTILIVNHFSGNGFWYLLEKLVKNLAEKIGFRSDFSYDEHILVHKWDIVDVKTVNLFGLSKFIHIKNSNHE